MAWSVTRYTKRCSCVTRRDQQPASIFLRGSGFPGPWNGSRIAASTRSSTLIAVLRSVLKDRGPLRVSLHLTSLDAVLRPFQAWSAFAPLVVAPTGDAARYVATVTGAQFPEDRRVRWPEAGRHRGLPAAGRSPFPAGPPPDRERRPDFDGGSYT
jgi:hypothetical protein